jgi:SAM-dependent methyltransferase
VVSVLYGRSEAFVADVSPEQFIWNHVAGFIYNLLCMDTLKEFYDLSALETANDWYSNDLLLPVINEFLGLFNVGGRPRILDFGCGFGHESMRLRFGGADVVGIDFSAESIRIARERNPDSRFYEMDFLRPDSDLGVFDGAFASGSFIHVPPSELTVVSHNLGQWIVNGEYLEIITQIGIGEKIVTKTVLGKPLERTLYLYNKEILEHALNNAGFRFVAIGALPESLRENNWSGFIFKKRAGYVDSGSSVNQETVILKTH